MSTLPNPSGPPNRRRHSLLWTGYQLRYVFLTGGALVLFLVFTGLYIQELVKPLAGTEAALAEPVWRFFAVGGLYVLIVSLAAAFLSHRAVGPIARLEEQIRRFRENGDVSQPLKTRDGDDMEPLVREINLLFDVLKRRK